MKKSLEPLHVQYSYKSKEVIVTNYFLEKFSNMKVQADVYNLDGTKKFSKSTTTEVGEDGISRCFAIPGAEGLDSVYFLRLQLSDATGETKSINWYWLSKKNDGLNWKKSEWYYTPENGFADFTSLRSLPKTTLKVDETTAKEIASHFRNDYIGTVVNHDIMGVQYAAVLKNIYALGAGIARGLDYGDNFLSVYIANSANEMVRFVREVRHDENGTGLNYAASAYLGDLLVTCYSLHSRNRTFGNMIGKGYSVKAAQLELNMVAEGYNASRCIHHTNENLKVEIPIADRIFEILWQHLHVANGFKKIETVLV